MGDQYLIGMKLAGFRCIKNVESKLTRLHAFIGPNDSGKSSILHAIHASISYVDFAFGFHERATPDNTGGRLLQLPLCEFTIDDQTSFGITPGDKPEELGKAFVRSGPGTSFPKKPGAGDQVHGNVHTLPVWKEVVSSRFVKLDPYEMSLPAQINRPEAFLSESQKTFRVAGILDAVMNRNPRDFLDIEDRFLKLFPTVRSLRLEVSGVGVKQISVELSDGSIVPPDTMSEGMLYFLGIAVLPYLQPVSVVLIEEPENGLHPSRIAEIMKILRELSKTSQVLLSTHSPLVINELHDDEVTLVTRTESAGTRLTPIANTKEFHKRRQVYALGELWLSYADGDQESSLVPQK